MASLPRSYRPTLQTITTASKANETQSAPDDIINLITEEAENRVIEDDRVKQGESALSARTSKTRKPRERDESGGSKRPTCENCGKEGHNKENCWAEGGGKEGQCLYKRKPKPGKGKKKGEEPEELAALADDGELFAFTCTSDYVAVAKSLNIPKSKLGAIVDSGANRHYCPDRSKFLNYHKISGRTIKSADGHTFKAIGMGDVRIDLLNGSQHT